MSKNTQKGTLSMFVSGPGFTFLFFIFILFSYQLMLINIPRANGFILKQLV